MWGMGTGIRGVWLDGWVGEGAGRAAAKTRVG